DPGPDLVLNANLRCCEDTCGPSSTTTTSTSSSSTSSTSRTTTTSASPTSTAVTTTVPQGPSTSASTTSTTPSATTAPETTPTTVPPPSCLDDPQASFDVVACRLRTMSTMLQAQSSNALGGAKSAHAMKAKIAQASRLVDTARTKRKPAATLRRAKQAIKSFSSLAKRGMRRHRIDGGLGGQMVGLASENADLIHSLRALVEAAPGPWFPSDPCEGTPTLISYRARTV